MAPFPVRVIAAVISSGDAFLVCKRPYEKRHGGLWEFPGGKCDTGESDFMAVRRELREELDLEAVEIGEEELAIRDPNSPFLIVFRTVRVAGIPTCREHVELKWASLHDLALLPLAPSDHEYVKFCLAQKG